MVLGIFSGAEKMEEKVLRISVGGNPIGMVGLEENFLQAKERRNLNEVEIEKFLLEEAKKKNFIPTRAEGEYAKALLREFKKFMGEKVEEDFSTLQVRVLGPGCVNCQKLEQETMAALAELNLIADFDHVQDIQEIAKYGVLGTPALVVNHQVKSVGRIPPKEQLKKWLLEGIKGK
jgi:small redox-active disulfide protein 2